MTVLSSDYIANLMSLGEIDIVPRPDMIGPSESGQASIDLRLGRWFRTMRQSRMHVVSMFDQDSTGEEGRSEAGLTKEYFVRFDGEFILHPGKFAIDITLEWLGLPSYLAGYVTGKSSLGRRGLIIETAAGIQPGFKGCLALELTNVGEVPLQLGPGMRVCQIFLHEVKEPGTDSASQFNGRRKPSLGQVRPDDVVKKLRGGRAQKPGK